MDAPATVATVAIPVEAVTEETTTSQAAVSMSPMLLPSEDTPRLSESTDNATQNNDNDNDTAAADADAGENTCNSNTNSNDNDNNSNTAEEAGAVLLEGTGALESATAVVTAPVRPILEPSPPSGNTVVTVGPPNTMDGSNNSHTPTAIVDNVHHQHVHDHNSTPPQPPRAIVAASPSSVASGISSIKSNVNVASGVYYFLFLLFILKGLHLLKMSNSRFMLPYISYHANRY